MRKLPKIAILGYGRAGKDEAGAWLGRNTPLIYTGSTSQVLCPLIAIELGISEEEAWNTRHANREYWFEFGNNYRKGDPAKIARKCLLASDMVIGLRDKEELQACKDARLFDLIIWIHRLGTPVDPTVTFSRNDCDLIIDNVGTLKEYHQKLHKLAKFAGLENEHVWDRDIPSVVGEA